MASVVNAGANQVKLDNGSVVTASQGAWYDGQQYWGGTLSNRGQINSLSNQQGAGQMVSKEVVAQTNPNNVGYVFGNAGDMTGYLNSIQNGIYSGYDVPGVQSTDQILSDLKKSGLLPTTSAPKAPDLVGTYQNLTQSAGVQKIQSDIADLKAQQDEIAAQALVNKHAEQNKPVAQNVIEGRITQEQQQAQDQYDFIGRQLSRKTDELNSALTNIQAIMTYTQQDYTNAETSYNDQFQQAISTINLIHGIQQDQKNDVQRATDNARANLQIFMNAITNGNISARNLPADQQAQLNKLEVQAGLPVGFMQSLQMDPSKSILYTGKTDSGQIQVLMRNPDGSISTQLYGAASSKGSSGGGGSLNKNAQASLDDQARQYLDLKANSYGDVDQKTWNTALQAYISQGGSRSSFIDKFYKYTDKNRGDFSSYYGFPNPGK